MPTSEPPFGIFFPKNRMTTNDTAGMSGTSHAWSRKNTGSALQHVDVVEIGAVQVAVDEQHHGQADADLGGGDGEHEQREHLAGDAVGRGRERDRG